MPILNIERMTDQRTRGYLYRVLAVGGLVLVGKGLITRDEFGDYLLLGAALLGFSVPAYNTPTKPVRTYRLDG